MKTFLGVVLLLFSFAAAAAFDYRAIDGDTINVPIGVVKNFPTRISVRFIGIDAPESGKKARCENERQVGEAATFFVRDFLATESKVTVRFVRWDKYGPRIDGRITANGKDLADELVKAGLAVPYTGGKRVNVWCPDPAPPPPAAAKRRRSSSVVMDLAAAQAMSEHLMMDDARLTAVKARASATLKSSCNTDGTINVEVVPK